jgi:hypothetical protein
LIMNAFTNAPKNVGVTKSGIVGCAVGFPWPCLSCDYSGIFKPNARRSGTRIKYLVNFLKVLKAKRTDLQEQSEVLESILQEIYD